MSEPSYVVDGINLEPAMEAAERIIGTSPRKAVYEMAWDLAEAAVRAAFPEIKATLSEPTHIGDRGEGGCGRCVAGEIEVFDGEGRAPVGLTPCPHCAPGRFAPHEIRACLLEPGGPIAAATNAVIAAELTDDTEQANGIAVQIVGAAVHNAYGVGK